MAAPIIVVLGPPGAGKGTQSALLAERLSATHLSSGELLRASDDRAIQELTAGGKLVESEDVQRVVDAALVEVPSDRAIVLDGFTRRLPEAKWLEQRARELGREIAAVIQIDISREVSESRNVARGRTDDDPEIVGKRWEEYAASTLPVIEFYRQRGLLRQVDGNGTVDEVAARIQSALMGV